jgi:hypothetical protein
VTERIYSGTPKNEEKRSENAPRKRERLIESDAMYWNQKESRTRRQPITRNKNNGGRRCKSRQKRG